MLRIEEGMGGWVSFFLLMAGLSGTLLALDLRGYFNAARNPIAELEYLEGTVKRLGNRQVSWSRASEGTGFALGDTISTGEHARARLTFKVGGQLEIGAGSMVKLRGKGDQIKLSFVTGSARVRVTAESAKKLTIADVEDEEEEIQISPKKKLASNTAKPLDLKPKKKPAARTVVETVAALPPPKPKEAKAPATSSSPDNAKPGAPVAVAQLTPPQPLRATVAIREELIRKPDLAMKTDSGKVAVVQKLPPAPSIVFPAEDVVVVKDHTQKAPVIEWAKTEGATAYEVSIKPVGGAAPPKVLRIEKNTLSAQDFGRGNYLVGVRAVTSDGKRGPASLEKRVDLQSLPKIKRKPKVLPVLVE